MPTEVSLATTMVQLADSLVEGFDVVDLLTLLSDRCVEVLDVQAAGVMLASPGDDLRVLASSSSVMRGLELFEEQAVEGPCQDCFVTGQPVVNSKLTTAAGRWPRFAPKALAAGFRSAHALPMHLREQTLGALNLFRDHEGELTDRELAVAQGFADMATIAILHHRTVTKSQRVTQQLEAALQARIAVEQAKGVVAERKGLDMGQAFSSLRNHASRHHVQLVDVARGIVSRSIDVETLEPSS